MAVDQAPVSSAILEFTIRPWRHERVAVGVIEGTPLPAFNDYLIGEDGTRIDCRPSRTSWYFLYQGEDLEFTFDAQAFDVEAEGPLPTLGPICHIMIRGTQSISTLPNEKKGLIASNIVSALFSLPLLPTYRGPAIKEVLFHWRTADALGLRKA